MKILQHISVQEFEALQKSDRVALVLMGGGAKGAYVLGVWKVLWKLKIRKFCAIAGTSVGALNALLIASGDPEFAENKWDEVISAGVLEKGRNLFSGVFTIILAHLLIFLSFIMALILLFSAGIIFDLIQSAHYRGQAIFPNRILLLNCIGFGFFFCGLTARMDADFLNWLSTGGYALPLFFNWPKLRIKLANWIFIVGAMVLISNLLYTNSVAEHLPWWTFWLLPLFWVLLVFLRYHGLRLLDKTLRAWPLFERKALDSLIAKLTDEKKIFSNCFGPVVATLARHSVYWDPYKVHPLNQRYHYYPIDETYHLMTYDSAWRYAEPFGEWVPEYINLKETPDPAWALRASSAIPFAFRAILRKRETPLSSKFDVYVDGGFVDNLPLLPAVEQKPDYIIVIALNVNDTLDGEETIKRRLQETWRKSFFSRKENDDIADQMRKEWIESLPVNYFTEGDELSRALAKNARSFWGKYMPMSPGPFPPIPPFGLDFGDSKVIFIRPSTATSINLPILDMLTGTMRFDPTYKKKLVDLGEKDANEFFKVSPGAIL